MIISVYVKTCLAAAGGVFDTLNTISAIVLILSHNHRADSNMRNPITMAAVLTAPIPTAFAQNLSSYNNGSIRVPSICSSGFLPGSDVALFTVRKAKHIAYI